MKEEIYGIIYLVRNKKNQKNYIGQTTSKRGFNGRYDYKGKDVERMYHDYENKKMNGNYYNKHLMSAIEKYGYENFEVNKELLKAGSEEELNLLEELMIDIFDSTDPKKGYNHRKGGNSSKDSEETKMRKSEAVRGENNPFYGKHHSKETRKRIGEKRKGTHMNGETKRKISKTNSLSNHPQAVSVICVTTGKIFGSIKEASLYYNCDSSSIMKVCKGKRNYCGKLQDETKLVWKFYESDQK